MKYSAEQLSLAGDKYLGRSYSEMDCQAFVEKCMSDVGYDRNLAGSNAWYRAMSWVGTPEECLKVFGQIPKGAFLFILKDNGKEPDKYKKDGIGNASHIGLKTGRGDGAIHSSSSKGCVCTSKFQDKTIPNGGWNRVGLLNVFTYDKSIDWVLEHGQTDPAPDPGGAPMQGTVVAESGSTVKLRQKPSTGCAYYWDIAVGSQVTILERGSVWSKITTGGLTGWMKNEFIQVEGEDDDHVAPDPDVDEDADLNPSDDQVIDLLAKIYRQLVDMAEEIVQLIGRG